MCVKALVWFSLVISRWLMVSKQTIPRRLVSPDDGGAAETLSAVIPVEGEKDLFIVTLGMTLCLVRWSTSDPDEHTVKPQVLHTVEDESHHINDAKCDPRGRLWAGEALTV